MYVPIIKKIVYSNDVLIERSLPCAGEINVAVGSMVEPFDELGVAHVSYKTLDLGEDIKLSKGKETGDQVYEDEIIGRAGLKKVLAPFSGTLLKQEDRFIIEQEKKEYQLLSGLWGEVVDVVEGNSVLLKTQCTNLHLMACAKDSVEGELIVFPNPAENLQLQYLEKYSKSVFRKILYIGDFVDLEVLKRAVTLGVSGVLAGSANRQTLAFARDNNLFLGLFSGFGKLIAPPFVFNTLKNVSNRFIFVQGENNIVRIPMPEKFDATQIRQSKPRSILRSVKKGMVVLVFDESHFAHIGVVEKVANSSILVKLENSDDAVEVKQSNILALV